MSQAFSKVWCFLLMKNYFCFVTWKLHLPFLDTVYIARALFLLLLLCLKTVTISFNLKLLLFYRSDLEFGALDVRRLVERAMKMENGVADDENKSPHLQGGDYHQPLWKCGNIYALIYTWCIHWLLLVNVFT